MEAEARAHAGLTAVDFAKKVGLTNENQVMLSIIHTCHAHVDQRARAMDVNRRTDGASQGSKMRGLCMCVSLSRART